MNGGVLCCNHPTYAIKAIDGSYSPSLDPFSPFCPPPCPDYAEKSIPIDWLTLKQALKEEVAAHLKAPSSSSSSSSSNSGTSSYGGSNGGNGIKSSSKQQQLFADVLKLLELLTLLQFSEDSR